MRCVNEIEMNKKNSRFSFLPLFGCELRYILSFSLKLLNKILQTKFSIPNLNILKHLCAGQKQINVF